MIPWNKVGIIKKCEYCGKEFSIKPRRIKTAKYCCKDCSNKARIGKPSKLRGIKYPQLSGINSPKWKGGVTPENEKYRKSLEIKLWRKSCMERDSFTCQKSGQKGGDLEVHHINNFADFPELRTSIENGITLSKQEHKNFHKKYGYKKNTKEQLIEFLTLS